MLALIEGRTDLPISGGFGAGKTRSAAILVVGLLVFEPNLNLMILTKENVAAQAFAEHIEGLNMPPSITSKIGRLVGYMELKKNKTNRTSLDVTCENRHDALRQKKLLIGCGGGFQQECSQSYSPVARWITEVALTLTDESQQYGNIEETSVIARTPRTCLNIWAGDHRQTPGGLKNTVECRLFRQKLLQRPLALRCGTEYVQPHEMYQIICRYLDGPWGSPSHQLKLLLEHGEDDPTDSEHITAVTQLWCEIFGNEPAWLNTSVCVTCFAILWLAIKGDGVSSSVATTLDAAAGLARRQKWGLILPSSARVSKLTYQTVIGVRYPELAKPTPDGWRYGRYVSTEATLQGGFLPIFWDVPKSTMQHSLHADCTTPLAPNAGKTPLHGRRFVYGYSLDGSDFPCYLLWPLRTRASSFCLLESQTRRYVDLAQAGFLHPLGLRHFYDGFSLRAEVSIRSSALAAFQLQEEQAAVIAKGWADHQEQPVDQTAPEADRRNVSDEIISVSDSEVDHDSTNGGGSSQASCSSTSRAKGRAVNQNLQCLK